jgi:hypothetical protein
VSMFLGTAYWNGTYDGKPALILSYYEGADLWAFDAEWVVKLHSNSLSALTETLGFIWGKDDPKELFSKPVFDSAPNIDKVKCDVCEIKYPAIQTVSRDTFNFCFRCRPSYFSEKRLKLAQDADADAEVDAVEKTMKDFDAALDKAWSDHFAEAVKFRLMTSEEMFGFKAGFKTCWNASRGTK